MPVLEGLCLGRGCDDLHREEGVQLVDRLELDDRCHRQPLRRRMPLQPVRLRGLLGLGVGHPGIVRAAGPDIREVIDEVAALAGRGVEDDLARLTRDRHAGDVRHARARLRIHDDEVLLLRTVIAPAPGDDRPHGVGRGRDVEHDAVVAQHAGVPGPGAVASLLARSDGGRKQPGVGGQEGKPAQALHGAGSYRRQLAARSGQLQLTAGSGLTHAGGGVRAGPQLPWRTERGGVRTSHTSPNDCHSLST